MSRIVFTNKDEFLKWIRKHCNPSQYEIYITVHPKIEIIAAPTKSTRRLRYAYTEMRSDWIDVETAISTLQANFKNGNIYMIDNFNWDLSRINFNDMNEFLRWIQNHCTPTQYEIYITSYAEIILAPTKSTRSLRYAHMNIYPHWSSGENARNEIKEVLPNVEMYTIKTFDWDSTRNVGVK